MSLKSISTFVVVMMATIVFAVGCQKPSDAGGHEHGDHGHDHGEGGHVHGPDCDHDHGEHGHDHAEHDHPAHGPNHGHIFDLDSDDVTCEWCKFKDNNVIRFHLLDSEGHSPKSMVVEKFLVKPLVGNDSEPFELEPEAVDPEGATSSFSLDDVNLGIAIPLGVGIEIVTEGKTIKGQIKAHEPLDH